MIEKIYVIQDVESKLFISKNKHSYSYENDIHNAEQFDTEFQVFDFIRKNSEKPFLRNCIIEIKEFYKL